MRKLTLLVVPLLIAGCRGTVEVRPPPEPVVVHPHPHPRPPPPVIHSPVLMSESQAIAAGHGFCQQRGYACDLKEAHMTGNDRWKVKFEATRGHARGKVHLEFDAISHALRKADENVKERGHGHDHDDDDDHRHGRGRGHDDDHDHDHGHGKGKGKAKGHAKHDD